MQTYDPVDYPHPGQELLTELESIGLSMRAFAHYIGEKAEVVSELCAGNIPMTALLACKVSRALGGGPMKWMQMQVNYDLVRVDTVLYDSIKTLGE